MSAKSHAQAEPLAQSRPVPTPGAPALAVVRRGAAPLAGEGGTAAPVEKPADPPKNSPKPPREIGGPKGPEPTRYGDWEVNGRCTDF